MKTPVLVGFAGYGYWGPKLARCFHGLPEARVSAACDPEPERLVHFRKCHPVAGAYADIVEMLCEAPMDALVVATPGSTHHKLARAGLLAGKHVLVEKPMALSSDDCLDLDEIALSAGLTLMVGHTYMYSEAVRMMFEIIDSGEIGEVRHIHCQRLNLGRCQRDLNAAWDLAPHDLSIILRVMGEMPLAVNCHGHCHVTPGIEDVTHMALTFSGDRSATIQSSWLEPRKVRQMTLVGTRGIIVYDDLDPDGKIRIHDVRVEGQPRCDVFGWTRHSYHHGGCRIPRVKQREPLARMCGHFIDCIRQGSKPESCGGKGTEVVRVLEACTESLRMRGAPISLQRTTREKAFLEAV